MPSFALPTFALPGFSQVDGSSRVNEFRRQLATAKQAAETSLWDLSGSICWESGTFDTADAFVTMPGLSPTWWLTRHSADAPVVLYRYTEIVSKSCRPKRGHDCRVRSEDFWWVCVCVRAKVIRF